jgi:hypothetical protein
MRMTIEVQAVPKSWTKRTCKIDGDQRATKHQPTWGLYNNEPSWFCKRCGIKMEHPLRT